MEKNDQVKERHKLLERLEIELANLDRGLYDDKLKKTDQRTE